MIDLWDVTARILDRSRTDEQTDEHAGPGPDVKIKFQNYGISESLIKLISIHQGLTNPVIADLLKMNKDSTSSILAKLTKQGKIKRIKGPKGFSYFKG